MSKRRFIGVSVFVCAGACLVMLARASALPATNLRFLSAVMWDGRESSATTTIEQDLTQQANDATVQGSRAQEKSDLVAFLRSL